MKATMELKNEDLLWSDKHKIYLTIGFKENLKYRIKPILIPLLYPIQNKDICLIVKHNRKETIEKLKAIKMMHIPTVITTSKLRAEYKSFEKKRILCSRFDMFLCENSIFSKMFKLLGRKFEIYKKFPIPIDLSKKDLYKEFERVLRTTSFFCRSGPCSTICIGTSDMEADEIFTNVTHTIDFISRIFKEDGLNSVKIMALKSQDSPALPIYKAGVSIDCDQNTIQT
ncbi:hypothetical protein HZS_1054 [Henneguya salminicola]|nr:hypothetical protein HZS_1054 [Henneguya salminicola]